MRKLLLATAAAALLSTPTLAADLAPAPVEPAPVYMPFTWTGFYVGVHAGYAWGDEDDDLDGRFEEREIIVEEPAASFDVNGFFALGGDITGNLSLDSNWQASIRARAGFAIDRALIYATGGVAFADADLE